MNTRLLEIHKQLQILNQMVSDYLKPIEHERIQIEKKQFERLKHIGDLSDGKVFEYENGIQFICRSKMYHEYEYSIYEKLMDGSLDKLILVKKSRTSNINNFCLNYEIESYEMTRLSELYRGGM